VTKSSSKGGSNIHQQTEIGWSVEVKPRRQVKNYLQPMNLRLQIINFASKGRGSLGVKKQVATRTRERTVEEASRNEEWGGKNLRSGGTESVSRGCEDKEAREVSRREIFAVTSRELSRFHYQTMSCRVNQRRGAGEEDTRAEKEKRAI